MPTKTVPFGHSSMLDMATPKPLLHVSYIYVAWFTLGLPVISLTAVVTIGMYLHFESTTATHCRVPNVVPSISAVIGGNSPERYIWRLGMAFFSSPRIFDSFLYYNYFSHSLADARSPRLCSWLNVLVWLLHVSQYLGLFGLSYISSTDNFLLHRNSFITFIVCSILHMVFFMILFKLAKLPTASKKEKLSYNLRLMLVASHILVFIASLYFYWRHNTYCEPYVYSLYSFCEYVVVVTNIAFHAMEALDFVGDVYISIAPPSRLKLN